MLQFLKRHLGDGVTPPVPPSRRKVWASGLFFVALAISSAAPWIEGRLEQIRSGPVKLELEALGTSLAEADRKGNAALAIATLGDATALLRRLNEQAGSGRSLRDCVLAAIHVSKGAAAVGDGFRWTSRAQFEAAAQDCQA